MPRCANARLKAMSFSRRATYLEMAIGVVAEFLVERGILTNNVQPLGTGHLAPRDQVDLRGAHDVVW